MNRDNINSIENVLESWSLGLATNQLAAPMKAINELIMVPL